MAASGVGFPSTKKLTPPVFFSLEPLRVVVGGDAGEGDGSACRPLCPSAGSHTWLIPGESSSTMGPSSLRSRSELKADASPTESPRCPIKLLFYTFHRLLRGRLPHKIYIRLCILELCVLPVVGISHVTFLCLRILAECTFLGNFSRAV